MFSHRIRWSLVPNRLACLLAEKRERGDDILDLTESNPTRARLPYPARDLLEALADRRALTYEPSPLGLPAAREAVAQYYASRSRNVSPEDIVLTASTSEAYAFLFKILADAGDEVLIPRPTYPLFDYLAALESVVPRPYPLIYDGSWSTDWAELEEAVGPRTRAVLAIHPGNPTGSYLKQSEVRRLVEICSRRGLALIVDEVFLDYPLTEDPQRAGSLAGEDGALTFVLSGLSKVAGLPQMKLSWIVLGGPERLRREVRHRLEHTSDVYLSVGASVQHAVTRFLALAPSLRAGISTRTHANLQELQESAVPPSPWDVFRAEGGWSAVLRVPAVAHSEEWAFELLGSDHVVVHPGYLFEFPVESHIVVSLLTPPEIFREGIHRISERVTKVLSSSR